MISQIDIYRSAKIFIDQHKEKALSEAHAQLQAVVDIKDDKGTVVWRSIIEAIRWMQSEALPDKKAIN